MPKITLAISPDAYKKLQRRAKRDGKPLEQVSVEILEASLGDEPKSERSGSNSAREILEEAGMLAHFSPGLRAMIIPGVSLEEARVEFSKLDGPSLSDIIIEQRGP